MHRVWVCGVVYVVQGWVSVGGVRGCGCGVCRPPGAAMTSLSGLAAWPRLPFLEGGPPDDARSMRAVHQRLERLLGAAFGDPPPPPPAAAVGLDRIAPAALLCGRSPAGRGEAAHVWFVGGMATVDAAQDPALQPPGRRHPRPRLGRCRPCALRRGPRGPADAAQRAGPAEAWSAPLWRFRRMPCVFQFPISRRLTRMCFFLSFPFCVFGAEWFVDSLLVIGSWTGAVCGLASVGCWWC